METALLRVGCVPLLCRRRGARVLRISRPEASAPPARPVGEPDRGHCYKEPVDNRGGFPFGDPRPEPLVILPAERQFELLAGLDRFTTIRPGAAIPERESEHRFLTHP